MPEAALVSPAPTGLAGGARAIGRASGGLPTTPYRAAVPLGYLLGRGPMALRRFCTTAPFALTPPTDAIPD